MKRIILTILFLFHGICLLCQEPSSELIKRVAEGFMLRHFPEGAREISSWKHLRIDSIRSLFIIELEPEGWILISADKRTEPVLGFSFDGEYADYESDSGHPGYLWIIQYHEQIKKIKNEKNIAEDAAWEELSDLAVTKNIQISDPWINSFIKVNWGQGKTYNQFCPSDPAGPDGHTWAGCIAVSMAQAMSVFAKPGKGTGSHSYVAPGYGTQYVNFEEAYYKWDSMALSVPDKYNALLLFHCAVSVDMEFGADGSGTQTSKASSAFKKYFSYSRRTSYKTRLQNDQEWEDLIDEQLIKGLPVIYSGDADDGKPGHAFNIDGVINGYYHINWGWSGTNNGYYKISSLRPGDYDFTKNHAAIIGIQPFYYPTDITLSDTVVKENVPAGEIVGIIRVEDEATDNSYSFSLLSDSTFSGSSWIKDYYLDGDSLKTGRVFTESDDRADTVYISLTDLYNKALSKQVILSVGTAPTLSFVPEENNSFVLFPNPASERIFINHNNQIDIISIHIYSITGTLAGSIDNPDIENGIQINALKRGIYILEAEFGNHTIIRKKFIRK